MTLTITDLFLQLYAKLTFSVFLQHSHQIKQLLKHMRLILLTVC